MSEVNPPEASANDADAFARKQRKYYRDLGSIKIFLYVVIAGYFAIIGYNIWHLLR